MKTKLDKLIRFALLAPFVAAMVIHGSTKPTPGPVFSFDNTYIGDGGSYATNDTVHVALTRRIMELPIDDCDVIAYMRERGSTNAADYVMLPTYKFGEYPVDFTVSNATNYNYWFYLDYVPPSPVHTNGVFELRGFEVAGEPRVPNPIFSAGFAQSAIVDHREIVPIEYLESTGTQHIDTGLRAASGWKIDITFSSTSWRDSAMSLFGARTSASSQNAFSAFTASQGLWPQYDGIQSQVLGAATVLGRKYRLVMSEKGAFLDGDQIRAANPSTFITPGSLYLFKKNQLDNGRDRPFYGRIYSVKLWNAQDDLVFDGQPVRVGRVGYMFDCVSGEYLPFGNKGTGSFGLGPDIAE